MMLFKRKTKEVKGKRTKKDKFSDGRFDEAIPDDADIIIEHRRPPK